MPLFKLIWLRRRRFSCQPIGDGMFGYNARMNSDPEQLTRQLASALLHGQLKICTAESCTGGLIAKTFTDLAGSSDWFERGFVTYSDQAKNEMLAVPASIIEDYGAVSEAVATAMASGALRHSRADYSVAVTGVAGPGGGSDEKPVGTVWIAVASAEQLVAKRYQFEGDRQAVRAATLQTAIELLLELVAQA
jgi:nicotinamide-nucleotide amidase